MKRTRSVLLCILIAALLMPTLSMLAGASVENTDEGWSVDLPFDTSTFGTDSTIFNSLNAKTGFDHPYLFANAQDFATMKARYDAGTDETFVAYVDSIIAEADAFIIKQTENNFTEADIDSGSYSSETLEPYLPVNPHTTNGGYDFGGRLSVLSNPLNENGTGGYASILEALGFAYQLTGNSFYGEFAYDWTLALCDWEHWGPGHFLNAAEAMGPLALSYDWLYDYYVANGKDVDVIRNAIYEKGVAEGYISSNGWFTEYTSSIGAWANKYHNTHNNWNPVCTNGMLIAAFSIMNDFAGDDETTFAISHYATQGGSLITNTYDASDAVAQAKYVVNNNLYYLAVNGLDFFNQDGSYIESSGYWAGSVRSLFSIFALLDSAVGTDFGFMEIPKLLQTAYFGVHIESSDYMSWPYHDDSARQLEHSWYYYIAKATGAYDLAGIRESELANGKRVFMWDVLHYDAIANATEASLPLDFAMNDIDGFVSRSSWTPGALYAGLMGGDNSTFGMHGHIDSGNWIYDNGGLRWFTDLGMDNYTIFEGTGYDGKTVTRWNYYKNGGEGQNNLILVGHDDVLPYGQTRAIVGNLERYADNLGGKGSYAIINNDTTYGSFVTSAKRGMLVTNDRSTVVIQDEVVTSGDAETFWWFAHYDTGRVRYVEISEDGRTAYMTGSNGKKLRVSLISDNADLKFIIKDTYNDFVLENTVKEGYSVANGGTAEAGRNSYRKLAIKAEDVASLNLAVVIELIGSETDPVGYTSIIPMSEWDDDTVQSGSHLTTPGNGYTVYYKDGTSITYDNSVITEESIKNVDIVRVVCHGNVVISTDSYNRNEDETELQLAPGQKLTIDLNGYTLIQSDELQLGLSGSSAGTSLTLMGGTLLPSNTIMARQETSLIMKDMVIIVRSAGCLIRNNRFTNLVFDGCTVEISGYLFASNMVDDGAGKEHNLIIKDTTMTLGTGLMMYGNGGWTNKYPENLNVYLFGDSSFMYGALENIIINGGADATDGTGDPGGERNFYVAVGTKLSSMGLPLPESADGQNYTAYYYSKISVDDDYNVTLGTPLPTQYDFIKSGTTYNGNDIYTVVCTDDTKYEIIFKDYDGTVISREEYSYGDTVILPAAPQRPADNTYTYAFAGWDSEVVSCAGDATYTATYTATYIEYTVIFKNDDGTVLSEKTYHYGDAVTAPEAVRTDKTYTYTFIAWDKDVTACTGNATYTAIYSREYINYTVVFKDDDGRVLSTDTYHYGDAVTVPEAPTKAADTIYVYTFSGWDKPVVNCAGNVIYVAVYDREPVDFAVDFGGIKPNPVRIDSAIAAQLVSAGYSYLQFTDEAAFNTANAGGYDTLAAGGKSGNISITGNAYVYLLANTSLTTYNPSAANLKVWLNLGGNKLTWKCNGGGSYNHDLAVFDGTLDCPWFSGTSGHAAYRASGSGVANLRLTGVTLTTSNSSGQRFFSTEGSATLNLCIENSKVAATYSGAGKILVHMGYSGTETP
ncbi:MAG: InlB B-repeat-containing protein, partial [Clostridia bacterium]|nr:InlB B-repeat-containing protein [Clostridia bacterium]